ncbi:hypothetical protein DevBK_05585 [Devosia sp. BK]|uniref:hypothetical protein n=1 Tax=unclassified Devosia TaxID=196773 RepID=UPI0012E83320|nr:MULTISPECIES: hypothetical protein [unclassified Devosia]MDV3250802.1 hypothetical protein [Devosia sp. BK]
MSKDKSTPAPLETEDGEQMDDNVNDVGQKSGDKKLEQPVDKNGKTSGGKTKT